MQVTDEKTWRYDIQHGPDGEANYAWVYRGKDMIATMKTHNAKAICDQMNAALSKAEPVGVGVKELIEQITGESGSAYCQSLRQFEKTECLGWEAKVKSGKFGKEEHDAHRKANELMGRHQGLARAASILREHLPSLSLPCKENGETVTPSQHVVGRSPNLDEVSLRALNAISGVMLEHNLRLAHGANRMLPDALTQAEETKEMAGWQVIIRRALLSVLPSPAPDVAGLTDAERLEDLRLAAKAVRTYMPDTLPAGEDGKIHFARALAESAAEAIEAFLASSEGRG